MLLILPCTYALDHFNRQSIPCPFSADPFRYAAYYATAPAIKIRRFPGLQVKFRSIPGIPSPALSPCKMDRRAGRQVSKQAITAREILVRRFVSGLYGSFFGFLVNDDEPLHDSVLWGAACC